MDYLRPNEVHGFVIAAGRSDLLLLLSGNYEITSGHCCP